jgi:hypothetical protein
MGVKHAVAGTVAIATTVVVVLAGCSSGSKGGAGGGNSQAGNPRSAVTTTDADWKPVADALGRTGKLGNNNTAYRVNLVRNDLQSRPTVWTSNPDCRWAAMWDSYVTTTTRRC